MIPRRLRPERSFGHRTSDRPRACHRRPPARLGAPVSSPAEQL